ncbi:MAG: hypothetical protein IKB22_09605 [Lentisphaeria bacterium]|nr:hypothetical protein [Lentisphaeria bacterium]
MKRTVWRMMWVLLTVFLLGCGVESSMIEITYPPETASAETTAENEPETNTSEESVPVTGDYVLNTSSKKFHDPSCSSVPTIKEKNREEYSGERAVLIERGFAPCKRCNP